MRDRTNEATALLRDEYDSIAYDSERDTTSGRLRPVGEPDAPFDERWAEEDAPCLARKSPEDWIPRGHPLIDVRELVDRASRDFSGSLVESMQRLPTTPERMLRALVLQVLFSIRSDRELKEQLDYNLLYRGFVGLTMDEPVWDEAEFVRARDSLLEAEALQPVLDVILTQAQAEGLLSADGFDVDQKLAKAWTGKKNPGLWLFAVFFISGAAALIYQVAWQRVLFSIYGIDSTSVTVVVTAFMLGLGVGSLMGGALSRVVPAAALLLFAAFELSIGAFGYFSLDIFSWVASFTLGAGHFATGVLAFLLVVFPTTLMGASLPLLVGHATGKTGNVGRSVGDLYFVNTLGAAVGCLVAVQFFAGGLGLAGSVRWAALANVTLGVAVWCFAKMEARAK